MFPHRTAPRLSRAASTVRTLLAVFTLLLTLQLSARAAGTFVPAPARVDVVYDSERDTLYITSGGNVLRYQLSTGTFLDPLVLGGSLSGLDLSPDNRTLAVADRTRTSAEVWVHLVDLQTGQASRATFPRGFGEGGTYTVAFGADGRLLVTSTYEGSGWVQLRRYDPATGASAVVASSVRHNTMLAASGDGSVVGFAESDSSDGPFGRYRVSDASLLRKSFSGGTGWFNFEIGVNRDGTQYALPTYGGTFIYDANLNRVASVPPVAGSQPIGVVYHPVEPVVYFAWAGTTQVRAHDAATFAQTAAYDFEYSFAWVGNFALREGRLRISRDGSLLFATVGGGVRFIRLYDSLAASDASAATDEDAPTSVSLSGSVGNGAPVSYRVVRQPAHGTLSGAGASLTYTPAPDYNGPDTFAYRAVYGLAESKEATVSLSVAPVNDAPDAPDQTVTTDEDTAVPVSFSGTDPDGDALTYAVVSGPAHGFVGGPGPVLFYFPATNYSGPDTITYRVSDGLAQSRVATISINVNPVNDAPVASGQSVSTSEDAPRAVTLSATDLEGDALTYVVVNGPAHGTLSGTGAARTYTPAANYNGPDGFTFKANDGAADSEAVSVSISVAPVNDAPVAVGDTATTVKNVAVSISVLANDSDVDGDALAVSSVTQPAAGTVTIQPGGTTLLFRPANNYTGTAAFTYRVTDGRGASVTANVLVTVNKK